MLSRILASLALVGVLSACTPEKVVIYVVRPAASAGAGLFFAPLGLMMLSRSLNEMAEEDRLERIKERQAMRARGETPRCYRRHNWSDWIPRQVEVRCPYP